jgi:hypothetical protein
MPTTPYISQDGDESHLRIDLDNAPEIATELGNICVAWAAIDFRIFAFFAAITRIPIALARATFFSHFNTRSRINLLKSAAQMVLLDDEKNPIPEFHELDELLRKVERSSITRNKFVHDPWCAWDQKPESVFQMRLGGGDLLSQGSVVRKHQLTHLLNQLQMEHGKLFDLYHRLLPLLPPLQQRLDTSRSLDLAFARKELPREIQKPKPPRQRRSSSPTL